MTEPVSIEPNSTLASSTIMTTTDDALVTDAELLFRYVQKKDNAAFRELVKTHFALVIGVCRQVLECDADAEDACQATFLILARQGHKVRDANTLAGWLYRVAYRVSCRARKQRNLSVVTETEQPNDNEDDILSRICRRETLLVLHEELNRLPQQYRLPIILHYLESQTREQTALQLDTTDASIKARLARGRRLLRSRLMRRGVALSVAVSLAEVAFTSEVQAASVFAEQIADSCLAQSMGNSTINTRSESLAHQEIGRMNLFSFTRPLVIAVPALCLMFLLGIGWYGYAQSSSDQGGEIQVDLSTPVTLDDLTPQAATTAITVAGASVEDNEFTPEQLPTIQSGDILAISVLGTMLESPIRGRYRVEPSGKVALGAPYGRVSVGGLNVEEAEDAITLFLKRLLQEPYVSVTFDHLPGDAVGQSSQRQTKLRPGESLRVRAGAGGSLEPIIDDVVQIEASGKVALPSLYKRLDAASRSIESLEEEIRSILAQRYKQPAVLITRISDGQADTSGIEAKLGEIERTLEEIKRKLK